MDKLQTLHEIDHPEVNVYPNIQPANIPSGAIDSSKLASGSVVSEKIANGAVLHDHIGTGAIHEDNIEDGAITTSKLGAQAVTTAKIADGAITTAKIPDNAITTEKIAPQAVTASRIAVSNDNLIEFLIDVGVTDFASAINAITRLLRDALPVAFFISEDLTKDIYKPVIIYVDQLTPEITFFGNVAGSFFRIASLGTDADWTQFVSDYRHILYMKVIR